MKILNAKTNKVTVFQIELFPTNQHSGIDHSGNNLPIVEHGGYDYYRETSEYGSYDNRESAKREIWEIEGVPLNKWVQEDIGECWLWFYIWGEFESGGMRSL